MITVLLNLFILVLILGIVWYCVTALLPLIPLGEPFATIARVLLIVIAAVIALYIIIDLIRAAGVPISGFGLR